MAAAPVHSETIPFKAAAFDGFPVRAAIDRGCSLTKVAFVPKDAPTTDPDTVPLRCLTFLNADFEDALRAMKAQAQLPESGELHVTGVGCANYKDTIEAILGLDTVFIDEFGSIGRGPFLLVNNAKPEDIFFPIPEIEVEKFVNEKMTKLMTKEFKTPAEDELFPALILYIGSAAGIVEVSKEGITKFHGGVVCSGRPFLGLAKFLVGTNKYEEVMELASRGDLGKVDMLVKDVMSEDTNAPYGNFPQDMPIFAFGKASDPDFNTDQCTREDVAQALVSMFVSQMMNLVFTTAMTTGITRCYVGGNFFRADIARWLFYKLYKTWTQHLPFDIKVLKTGHTGAISAMLTRQEDQEQLLKGHE